MCTLETAEHFTSEDGQKISFSAFINFIAPKGVQEEKPQASGTCRRTADNSMCCDRMTVFSEEKYKKSKWWLR